MRAGKLRHRVALQRRMPSTQLDAAGQPSGAWRTHRHAWASIEPLSGREAFAALEAGAKVTHQVRIRYRRNILPIDRVSYQGRRLYVESVIDVEERERELVMMCEERVDER